MSEISWIKLKTNMFEDEKIDFIESLPEADSILLIWIKLLTMAGKCNAGGYLMLTENIPYTTEMLTHKFRKPLNTVKLALETLLRLDMISYDDNTIKISNWEKHQNIEGMEKVREQARIRKQRQREKEKKLMLEECHVTSHVTLYESHATDIDKELDKEKELKTYMCVSSENQTQDVSEDVSAENLRSSKLSGADSDQTRENRKDPKHTEEFEKIWSVYPRKKEKTKARKAFMARLKEKHKAEDMYKAVINYAKYCKVENIEERYIKHLSTFLGPNVPYEDYIKYSPPAQKYVSKKSGQVEKIENDNIERDWDDLEAKLLRNSLGSDFNATTD